jgi:hypothetical protein
MLSRVTSHDSGVTGLGSAGNGADRDGFSDDLLAAMPDDAARRAARRVLARWEGCRIYLRANRGAEARCVASVLTDAGLSGAVAVDLLVTRVGCSERHARRLLREAADAKRQAMSAGSTKLPA